MGVRQLIERPGRIEKMSPDDEEIRAFVERRKTQIKVVGCGGAGNNTITRLTQVGITGAETVAINTDAMDLLYTEADKKLIIGKELTQGLGAGASPAIGAEAAKEKMEQGYTAIKMNGTPEIGWIDSFTVVQDVLERVQSIRDLAGYKMDIAVDFHGRVHKGMAKVLMKELEQFKLMFIEEPVLCENEEAFVELKRYTSTPIATGERNYTRWGFKKLLHDGGVDIIQAVLFL